MRQLGLPPKNAPNCVVMESKSEEEESGGVSPPHHSYMTLKSSEVQSLHRVKTPSSPSSRSKKLSKFDRAKMPIIMIIRFMRYLHQTVGPSQTYHKPVFICYILLFLLWYMNSAFKCILNAYYHMPKELLNCSKLIGQRRSEYFGVGLSLCEVLKQGNSAF